MGLYGAGQSLPTSEEINKQSFHWVMTPGLPVFKREPLKGLVRLFTSSNNDAGFKNKMT